MSNDVHRGDYNPRRGFEKGGVVKMCTFGAFDSLGGALPPAFGLPRDIWETKTNGEF